MDDVTLDELTRLAASRDLRERLRAMDAISAKRAGRVVRKTDDPRVVTLLLAGLTDSSLRVRRAAARGLRPWVTQDPAVLDSALSVYATDLFDGSYSHAGLYDTRSGAVWVPRFHALKGHAALLSEGNTDRFFKFEFFVSGQAPRWIPDAGGSGHLVLHIIPEWSYSRQQLVPEHDERRMEANLREQEQFGRDVQAFFERARLPYDVRVHRILGGGGHHRRRETDVERIVGAFN
jgi:hypothetical protein